MSGPDVTELKEGDTFPLAIYVQIAGREFQDDFEPIMERQIHHLVNYIRASCILASGISPGSASSKSAMEKGFSLKDIGVVLHAKFHQDFRKLWTRSR
ncbi:MAG: hypothetical protein R2860_16375 [Desulfobacterales bacterium]